MERFANKVAVVTGSSSGIGASISKELVKHGVNVVGLARRLKKLLELEKELSEAGKYPGKFYPLQCDISKENEVLSSFEWISTELGPVSILVNNAAVGQFCYMTEIPSELISQIFDTNVKASILCCKEAVKIMNENSIDGHIINMNSITGQYIFSGMANKFSIYSSAKHALRVVSEALRRELVEKKSNIKVTNISPGRVKTRLTRGFPPSHLNDELQPEDIAKACISVLSTSPNVVISELTILPLHQPM